MSHPPDGMMTKGRSADRARGADTSCLRALIANAPPISLVAEAGPNAGAQHIARLADPQIEIQSVVPWPDAEIGCVTLNSRP